jgi:hypothetical protein
MNPGFSLPSRFVRFDCKNHHPQHDPCPSKTCCIIHAAQQPAALRGYRAPSPSPRTVSSSARALGSSSAATSRPWSPSVASPPLLVRPLAAPWAAPACARSKRRPGQHRRSRSAAVGAQEPGAALATASVAARRLLPHRIVRSRGPKRLCWTG